MKNLVFILLLPLFFIYSCEEETQSGYDCISNTCTDVFDNPQYLTLSDCQSTCADNSNIEIGAEVLGCTDTTACNYNSLATEDDASCTYAEANLDCDGNPISLNYSIGDLVEGGIVFYIDATGEHGLVAALEDITEGSNMGSYGIPEGFEWGCFASSVSGADGYAIGTGYQNTLDISAQNCQTEQGGITAAQAALNYETEGYTDWFLPSRYELVEMYNTIGNGGNIGGFETIYIPHYWSSSESNNTNAWLVNFSSGYTYVSNKNLSLRVRVVRAF
jgi:hypothetical protein